MVWQGCTFICLSRRLSVCLSVGLSTKLVNTIQTELLQLGPSNLVHIFLITRGQHLFIFKVSGQRSRSHATSLKNLVNKKQSKPFQLVRLVTHTSYDKRRTLIDLRSGVKGQGHTLHIVVKCCKNTN